ncbi:MAG: hypothetical protein H0U56_13375 [Methylibium sp.]|nr:hypothetical protein [Methylibium sp.]
MRANKARFALTLSLALVLAACGGGGGGGGDDNGGNGSGGNGGGGNSSGPPPAGSGDFDGSYVLRATNDAGEPFDQVFAANFTDGRATVAGGLTEFEYPLESQGSGCYFKRGDTDHCVERAAGHVVAVCTAPDDARVSLVGIRNERQSQFKEVNLQTLTQAAAAIGPVGLQFKSLTCANTLNDNNTVTIFSGGTARQSGVANDLDASAVNQLFSPTGAVLNNPPARVGQKVFSYDDANGTTYYIVNFAAVVGTQGNSLSPVVFVSVNGQ